MLLFLWLLYKAEATFSDESFFFFVMWWPKTVLTGPNRFRPPKPSPHSGFFLRCRVSIGFGLQPQQLLPETWMCFAAVSTEPQRQFCSAELDTRQETPPPKKKADQTNWFRPGLTLGNYHLLNAVVQADKQLRRCHGLWLPAQSQALLPCLRAESVHEGWVLEEEGGVGWGGYLSQV